MSIPVEVVTANTIYDVNNVALTTSMIKSHLNDYRKLVQDVTTPPQFRLQAWQFVKAYTRIVEDRKQWRGGDKC